MVYGWHPFISMCDTSFSHSFGRENKHPGTMLKTSAFIEDNICPFWTPPDPKDKDSRLGGMTSVALSEDGSLLGLFRWVDVLFD